MLFFGNWQISI